MYIQLDLARTARSTFTLLSIFFLLIVLLIALLLFLSFPLFFLGASLP